MAVTLGNSVTKQQADFTRYWNDPKYEWTVNITVAACDLLTVRVSDDGYLIDTGTFTFNGDAFTQTYTANDGDQQRCSGWHLVTPDVGTYQIYFESSYDIGATFVFTELSGVDTADPIGASNSFTGWTGSVNTKSLDVTTADGDMVLDIMHNRYDTITKGGSQTSQQTDTATPYHFGASSRAATGTPTTMTWDFGSTTEHILAFFAQAYNVGTGAPDETYRNVLDNTAARKLIAHQRTS